MIPLLALRVVVIRPEKATSDESNERAIALAERSRQLRIGLLENKYNQVAVLPADTFFDRKIGAVAARRDHCGRRK